MSAWPPLPAVWLPTVRVGTGTDVFTEQLAAGLEKQDVRAEITWLPHRTEYLPFFSRPPSAPPWANVVHTNSWLHLRLLRNSRLPLVVTCHGCVHDPALGPYKSVHQELYHRLWIRRLEATALRRADRITAVSSYTADQLKRTFGDYRVKVIPNWLPTEAFHPPKRTEPNHPFRLIYIGHLSRRKGADLLPAIMGKLGDEFELLYTGARSDFRHSAANMHSIGWASERPTVRNWLMSSDALLFPSRMEGMPLAVLEAMACGLPAVSSNAASLPEVIKHGENGMVCPADDVDAFVAAIRFLRENVGAWRSMSQSAHEMAKNAYSERRAIEEYIDCYRDALAARYIASESNE